MKVRAGFVSNSSSASYYVTLRGSPKEVLDTIAENCNWPYLQTNIVLEQLKNRLESNQKRLDKIANDTDTYLIYSKAEIEKNIEYLKEQIVKVNEIIKQRDAGLSYDYGKEEIAKIAFELNYIKFEEEDDQVVLESTTIMHNNYVEGMPEFLQDIVLYYSFEQRKLISVRVAHSG